MRTLSFAFSFQLMLLWGKNRRLGLKIVSRIISSKIEYPTVTAPHTMSLVLSSQSFRIMWFLRVLWPFSIDAVAPIRSYPTVGIRVQPYLSVLSVSPLRANAVSQATYLRWHRLYAWTCNRMLTGNPPMPLAVNREPWRLWLEHCPLKGAILPPPRDTINDTGCPANPRQWRSVSYLIG